MSRHLSRHLARLVAALFSANFRELPFSVRALRATLFYSLAILAILPFFNLANFRHYWMLLSPFLRPSSPNFIADLVSCL